MSLKSPREANGPDGYPIPGTNPAWDELCRKVVEARRPDAERARAFLKKLQEALHEKAYGQK